MRPNMHKQAMHVSTVKPITQPGRASHNRSIRSRRSEWPPTTGSSPRRRPASNSAGNNVIMGIRQTATADNSHLLNAPKIGKPHRQERAGRGQRPGEYSLAGADHGNTHGLHD